MYQLTFELQFFSGKVQLFQKIRKINPNDTLEEMERKIRAFWYTPYDGAYVELHGQKFTIINEKLLAEIGVKYKKSLFSTNSKEF